MTASHVALVPVKPPGLGKSRLGEVPARTRGRLAVAFATDTLRTCLTTSQVAHVLVITEDPGFAEYAASLGAVTTSDGHTAGLNAALRHGAGIARQRWSGARPFALCADLPAVRPHDLDAALSAVGTSPCYVPDARGTGTTLYSAAYDDFDPRFGTASAAAHARAGALGVGQGLTGLRQDVDDMQDLRDAIALGVGAATNAVLAQLPETNSS